MQSADAERLTRAVQIFVTSREDLRALAVCGSWARGNGRADSDLDMVIIARDPDRLRQDRGWIDELRFADAGFHYQKHHTATYGVVWSAHILLEPAARLDLTFAGESWASTYPIDQGTRRIVSDGFKIVLDKDGILQRLVDACR